MTVKLPWTDRRRRSLARMERPNVNLPSVDLSNVQVPRPSLPHVDMSGIRAPLSSMRAPELPQVHLPSVDLSRVDMPRMDLRRVDLPHIDLSHMDLPHMDLPHVDLPHVDLPDVNLPRVDLRHVDLPEVDLGSVGRAVSGAISGIAETLSEAFSDTGDRARDAVGTVAANLPADLPLVARLRPKPRNTMRPRIMAIAAVSAIAAAAAGIYLLFVPGAGARRRAALRRRLRGTPAAAQRGIGAAVGSAKQVGDRAVELVRVPIDTARDIVGNRTSGDGSDGSGEGLHAMNGASAGEMVAVDEAEVMAANPLTDAPVDMTAVAIEAEAAENGYTDADAAASIYGEPTILTDGAVVESSELAEARSGGESQNG